MTGPRTARQKDLEEAEAENITLLTSSKWKKQENSPKTSIFYFI